jgi:hypothetical protein
MLENSYLITDSKSIVINPVVMGIEKSQAEKLGFVDKDVYNQDLLNAIKEDKTLIQATLSRLGFIYDALLVNDKENGQFVLEDIRQKYAIMLNKGATSWWETLGGVTETDKACSLCHGWSSIPIYYYNKILGEKI